LQKNTKKFHTNCIKYDFIRALFAIIIIIIVVVVYYAEAAKPYNTI